MAGRLLLDEGYNRQVELSQVVHGSGSYASFRQVIASFSGDTTAWLHHVSSEQETVVFELSFEDIETLFAALQEYKQAVASLDSNAVASLDDYPF